jgi:hypothetical protein
MRDDGVVAVVDLAHVGEEDDVVGELVGAEVEEREPGLEVGGVCERWAPARSPLLPVLVGGVVV